MLQQLLRMLVDRRKGIVTSIDYVPPIAGGPIIHTYRGALAQTYAYCEGKMISNETPPVIVSGTGFTPQAALWSLLGEAVERYCAYSFDASKTVTAPFNSLNDKAISPEKWIGFDYHSRPIDLFKYKAFDVTQPIRWVAAKELTTAHTALVPAAHVWLRLGKTLIGENFVQRTSTGLGAGTCLYQAILSGLLEVIERDAFSTRWLLSASPPKRRQLSAAVVHLSEEFTRVGICLELFDLAVDDFAPVSLAKLTLNHRPFGLCLGASSACNQEQADIKAALEAYHILQGMLFWQSKSPAQMALHDIRDFVDHGRYYSQPGFADAIQWFFENTAIVNSAALSVSSAGQSDEAAIKLIVKRLNDKGLSVYYVILTSDEIRESGFVVVKVLIPGMQPLTCGERVIADDPRRLKQVSLSLTQSDVITINRTLQPFA